MAAPFTPEQIAGWRAQRDAAKKRMEDSQREVWALNKLLEGVSMWEGLQANMDLVGDTETTPDNFMGTLERIANEAPAPVPRTVIKKQMASLGFSDKQLGNYFYSVVARLKDSKRITVMGNGDLWGKPK